MGVILNLGIWFAIHVIWREVEPFEWGPVSTSLPVPDTLDAWALALSALAIIAVFRLKLGIGAVIGGAALAGLGLHLAGAI